MIGPHNFNKEKKGVLPHNCAPDEELLQAVVHRQNKSQEQMAKHFKQSFKWRS